MIELGHYKFDSGAVVSALFPKPVYSNYLNRDFSNDEVQCFTDIALSQDRNVGNTTSVNHHVLDDGRLSDLNKWFELCVGDYFKNIICPSDDITPYITLSWLNFTNKGEHHHKHIHHNSIVSGVFYINTNEDDKIEFYIDEVHESIQFSIDDQDRNTFNSTSWWLPVQTGKLLLFPSSLRHSVPTVMSDKTRASLSFNVFVKGILGTERNKSLSHFSPLSLLHSN